jgi:hypothetical protein
LYPTNFQIATPAIVGRAVDSCCSRDGGLPSPSEFMPSARAPELGSTNHRIIVAPTTHEAMTGRK